ncbi:MAG: sulfhydrogenase subunit delta [Candidatus Thiodiazotropha sp.]
MTGTRPKLAVHKFSSCDGCQLALLNLGEPLLLLPQLVDIVHFAEAGPSDPVAQADIALVEGSVSTPEDIERIRQVRKQSSLLISIGACAGAGGLQALANFTDRDSWMAAVYEQPDQIDALQHSNPISHYVRVDFEIPGCPVNSRQVVAALRDLLSGVKLRPERRSVCMECKRKGLVCTMVSKGEPCMGPVTVAGCGALCPSMGRGCYSCYGPLEQINDRSLAERFNQLGLDRAAVARRFHFIANHAPAFKQAGERLKETTNE